MKSTLYACAAAILLSVTAHPALSSPYKQADTYFEVRSRAQLVDGFTMVEVQNNPQKFAGKILEVRGVVSGIVIGDNYSTLIVDDHQGGQAFTVMVQNGKKTSWPFLVINSQVRALCVAVQTDGSGGGLEAQVAVKEDEAAYVDRERGKADRAAEAEAARQAALSRGSNSPRTLSSRGMGAGSIGAATGGLSDADLTGIYAGAVRYFNRHLAQQTANNIAASIIQYSRRYELDARLVMAVIACESNFNPNAVSRVGAQGLGQLMPGTAAGLGVGNPWDTRQNLEGSTRLLRGHLSSFGAGRRPELSHIKLALACYNAGAGAVRKFKGIPPYRETQNYVKKITRLYWQMLPQEERTWSPD